MKLPRLDRDRIPDRSPDRNARRELIGIGLLMLACALFGIVLLTWAWVGA